MNKLILFSFALLGASLLSHADDLIRDWTNTAGKTISASLQEMNGNTATLRMSNGRTYDVSVDTLSEADNAYVKEWLAAKEVAAKAGEMKTELGQPTEAIIESTFEGDAPATRKADIAGWKAGIGEWRIEEGVLIGDELEEDNHASSLTQTLEATHLVIKAQVQLGTAESIAFACRDTVPPNLHLGRLYITQDKLWIQHMTGISKTTIAERIATLDVDLDPEAWYDVTIEIVGDQYRAVVGDEEIEATHARFADAKGIVALVNKGKGARFKDVSLWHAEPVE